MQRLTMFLVLSSVLVGCLTSALGPVDDTTPPDAAAPPSDLAVGCFTEVGRGAQGLLCALESSGRVVCQGAAELAAVPSLPPATAIAVGNAHACALLQDHTVSCWGQDAYAQLGDGKHVDRATPGPVLVAGGTPLDGVTQISASGGITCALRAGEVWCWGRQGASTSGDVARRVDGLPVVEEVVSGDSQSDEGGSIACARTSGGEVWCWTDVSGWDLERGPSQAAVAVAPYRVDGLGGRATALDGGGLRGSVCARRDDGHVGCVGLVWGRPSDFGMPDAHGSFVLLDELGAVERVVVATYALCGVRPTGELACWGFSDPGGSVGAFTHPGAFAGARSIAERDDRVCSVTADGRLRCDLPLLDVAGTRVDALHCL